MCYDIAFKINLSALSDYFPEMITDPQVDINFERDHIVAHAFGNHPIIYINPEDKKIHLRPMEWGVIPFYVKDEAEFLKQRAFMLNARSERILEDKRSYWYKIRNRRCLIPVTGTFDHRAVVGWPKKVPYLVRPKKQSLFFVPGLYSVAELPDKETGEVIKRYTFTLITRVANDVMKNIHNDGPNRWRMPLFLPFKMAKEFLSEDLSEKRYKEILDYEMPPKDLLYYPVYTIRSSKPRPDNKDRDEPYEWAKLPPLGEKNPVV
jgi:putative SOS response-associated peptidase YedK